jgi:hypothetical protein
MAKKEIARPVYMCSGTVNEDLNSPQSPFQGLCVTTYRQFASGEWAFVLRNKDGTPNFGYLAKAVTKAEFDMWAHRIKEAKANPTTGYVDSGGHWFPGNLVNSVITADAHKKYMDKLESGYYTSSAQDYIVALANTINATPANRIAEYEARYQEAKEFQAGGKKDFKLLKTMEYKGLSMEAGAAEVIAKYEAAKANETTLADLRMRRNLLKSSMPLAEKRSVYKEIVEGLKSLQVN